jgi:hypothetical protein
VRCTLEIDDDQQYKATFQLVLKCRISYPELMKLTRQVGVKPLQGCACGMS